jgi:hypothetical protein
MPALVDVQLHTHRHRTPRDESLFRRELRDNRAAMDRIGLSGQRTTHFCYPSGDYITEFGPWLRAEGVEWATTCDVGLASATDSPLFLPRIIDSEGIPDDLFDGWILGTAALLPYQRRAVPPAPLVGGP